MAHFTDIRDFFTAIVGHECPVRSISSADVQGTSLSGTSIGFRCACGEDFQIGLSYVKVLRKPLRPYLMNTAVRLETARRLTVERRALLAEMRMSGGWDQPDPGVARLTLIAAASGPPGNTMEHALEEMVAPLPRPN